MSEQIKIKKTKKKRSEADLLADLPTLCCVRPALCVHTVGKIGFQIYCNYCGKAGDICATLTKAADDWTQANYKKKR